MSLLYWMKRITIIDTAAEDKTKSAICLLINNVLNNELQSRASLS